MSIVVFTVWVYLCSQIGLERGMWVPGCWLFLVWRTLEDNVWLFVCLYLGGLVTWGQDERLWSLIYCGGFVRLWLSHTLALLLCFHLQSFSWIKMWAREKKKLTTNVFKRDEGRRGISILTSSQGQADMWLDVWCQPQGICLHKLLKCWLCSCKSTLLSYLALPSQ